MHRQHWASHVNALALFFGACLLLPADADEPSLGTRIDQLIEAKAGGALAATTTDVEFARRIYLDLAGRIPSSDELASFLADASPQKRAQLIDRLLASDDHVRRLSRQLHVMFMERLGDHEEWQKFLRESVRANKPWDQLVREILSPNAESEQTRGSALWFTKRLESYGQNPVDVPALVRDVGRHFLGIDVQCAQCHDHLFVDDYKQQDYQGLLAFVGHVGIRADVKFPAVAVPPLEKKLEFMSVFVKEPKSTGPKLPGGAEIEIPVLTDDQKFIQPPDKAKNFPGVAKFNTLHLLSEQLPQTSNRAFARNIANRLWWVMMGRGLVEPLDLQHADNPPSHPELLDLLSTELTAHRFDMRWLLREIALSQAYQRSSQTADAAILAAPASSYRLALEKPLSAEQMLASMRQALGGTAPIVIEPDDKTWSEWQTRFEKSLANPPREPEVGHSPTVKGALFLLNDTVVQNWLASEAENLPGRLAKIENTEHCIETLYLAILSRSPSDEERAAVANYLAQPSESRERSIRNLVWSLLASNEFCTNH